MTAEASSGELDESWTTGPISLAFRLGERTLFRPSIPGVRFTGAYHKLGTDPQETLRNCVAGHPDRTAAYLGSHPVAQPPSRRASVNGWLLYTPRVYRRHFVEITGTFEEYLAANFGGKSRSTLRRKVRKLEESAPAGTASIRTFATVDQVKEFLALAERVSAASYQERLLEAGLPTGPEFAARVEILAQADRFRGYIVFVAGNPAAYLYAGADQFGVLYYDYVGFDPAYRDYSAGTVLLYYVLEELFQSRRFHRFDFTEGEGAHKETFATANFLCADIYAFRPTIQARALLAAHRVWEGGQGLARQVLDRLGLKTRLKRFIRRASTKQS